MTDNQTQFSKPPFVPTAVYFHESDSLEYVRRDVPSVYRRVDSFLTLILEMHSRELLGLKIKGFKNYVVRHNSDILNSQHDEFPMLVSIIEGALKEMGDAIFSEQERRISYEKAIEIAKEDKVQVHDMPLVA